MTTTNNNKKTVGVGWLSDDKTYIKLRLTSPDGKNTDYIMRKSKLPEKTHPGQADYIVYVKNNEEPIDF